MTYELYRTYVRICRFKQLNVGDVFTSNGRTFLKISTELDNRTDVKRSDLPHLKANCFSLDKHHYYTALPDNICKLIKTPEMFYQVEIDD